MKDTVLKLGMLAIGVPASVAYLAWHWAARTVVPDFAPELGKFDIAATAAGGALGALTLAAVSWGAVIAWRTYLATKATADAQRFTEACRLIASGKAAEKAGGLNMFATLAGENRLLGRAAVHAVCANISDQNSDLVQRLDTKPSGAMRAALPRATAGTLMDLEALGKLMPLALRSYGSGEKATVNPALIIGGSLMEGNWSRTRFNGVYLGKMEFVSCIFSECDWLIPLVGPVTFLGCYLGRARLQFVDARPYTTEALYGPVITFKDCIGEPELATLHGIDVKNNGNVHWE